MPLTDRAIANLGGLGPRPLWPYQGRSLPYDPRYDRKVTRYTDGLTFDRLARYLRTGDDGDAATMLQLAEEMEAKDERLGVVARTRRGHLTGKPWTIEPDEEYRKNEGAQKAATYCNRVLRDMPAFAIALKHLATAIGRNLAACELVWRRSELVDIDAVSSPRLTMDLEKGREIRIIDNEHALGYVPPAGKFIFHIPEPQPVSPFASTLMRAAGKLWLIKNGNLADWASYNETFGMPWRIGRYPKDAPASLKDQMQEGLESLGTDAYGMFEQGWEIELVESSARASQPFGDLDERCDRAMAILFLGANLTTDTTGGTGTFAAANVHDRVRGDLQADDAEAEDFTLREQLLRPMVEFRFPGEKLPIPHMRRKFQRPGDKAAMANTLTVATQQMGLPVAKRHVYEVLEIPEPDDDDKLIERMPQGGMGLPAMGAP